MKCLLVYRALQHKVLYKYTCACVCVFAPVVQLLGRNTPSLKHVGSNPSIASALFIRQQLPFPHGIPLAHLILLVCLLLIYDDGTIFAEVFSMLISNLDLIQHSKRNED